MKQYTRREALKLFGIGTVTIAGFGLAGCSGSGEGVKNASEPVPASQAFGQAGVWMVYGGDEQIGKDTGVERVLVFDGNGNVTVYDTKYVWMNGGTSYVDVTFGDLDGMSNDEIIDLAKKKDRERFDATKQSAIDETNEDIEEATSFPPITPQMRRQARRSTRPPSTRSRKPCRSPSDSKRMIREISPHQKRSASSTSL